MSLLSDKLQVQTAISIASFASGVIIACVCLFAVKPYGEISNTAISIVSELLVLCGALLGVKTAYDNKMRKFAAEMDTKIENIKNKE